MFGKIAAAAVLSTALAIGGTSAFAAGIELTDEIKDEIRTTLTGLGYEVAKIKTEDGLYEAYARKDGKRYEVFLNHRMVIVRRKEN